MGGNDGPILTITASPSECVAKDPEPQHRCGVILTARIHPGESNSSYVMKGVIDFLTRPNSVAASLLRRNFVFKVVPMVNPDGVVYGNYRTSLAGQDLNRKWRTPSTVLFPEVFAIKRMVAQVARER